MITQMMEHWKNLINLNLLGKKVTILSDKMEEYLYEWYQENTVFLRSEIQIAKNIDISYLPEKRLQELNKSFLYAEKTFNLFENIFEAKEQVIKATPEYRPIHKLARKQEKIIRNIDKEIENLNNEIRRIKRS